MILELNDNDFMKAISFETKFKHIDPEFLAVLRCADHKQPVTAVEVLVDMKRRCITLFCTKCEQPLARFEIQNGIAFE